MKSEIPAHAGSARAADPDTAIALARGELEAFRNAFLQSVQSASPADCRSRARRCQAQASVAATELACEFYLRMALLWRLAAAQLERREVWTSPPRGQRREAN
jgi:hypothetical protein